MVDRESPDRHDDLVVGSSCQVEDDDETDGGVVEARCRGRGGGVDVDGGSQEGEASVGRGAYDQEGRRVEVFRAGSQVNAGVERMMMRIVMLVELVERLVRTHQDVQVGD